MGKRIPIQNSSNRWLLKLRNPFWTPPDKPDDSGSSSSSSGSNNDSSSLSSLPTTTPLLSSSRSPSPPPSSPSFGPFSSSFHLPSNPLSPPPPLSSSSLSALSSSPLSSPSSSSSSASPLIPPPRPLPIFPLPTFPLPTQTTDLTDPSMRFSGWIPFTSYSRQAIMLEGLRGCTVIAAFSSQGMCATHIWEACGRDNEAEHWIATEGTLHPGNGVAPLRKTLEDVYAYFAEFQGRLQGGRLLVVMPAWTGPVDSDLEGNSDENREEREDAGERRERERSRVRYKYDEMRYERLRGRTDVPVPNQYRRVTGVPELIKRVAQESTGLKLDGEEGMEVKYRPYALETDEEGEEKAGEGPEGTFVMLFEPAPTVDDDDELTPGQILAMQRDEMKVWIQGWRMPFS